MGVQRPFKQLQFIFDILALISHALLVEAFALQQEKLVFFLISSKQAECSFIQHLCIKCHGTSKSLCLGEGGLSRSLKWADVFYGRVTEQPEMGQNTSDVV